MIPPSTKKMKTSPDPELTHSASEATALSIKTLEHYLADRRAQIEAQLERDLPAEATRPSNIHQAMRYSIMAGGKRIRPMLAVAAAEACGATSVTHLLRPFAALELIHTYSLIHDDLPALDNDDLRRGRPTSHKVFGEAMAILAGDALLTEGFRWLSIPLAEVSAERQLRAVNLVAEAVDSRGMIGGQVADIEAEKSQHSRTHESSLDELLFIHRNKTGRLLTASVLLGGLLAGASEDQLKQLEIYGESMGLAFQIVDDLLDSEQPSAVLGKTAGKDVAQGKLTWPGLVGAESARREAAELLSKALKAADMISPEVNYLGPLARYICDRSS